MKKLYVLIILLITANLAYSQGVDTVSGSVYRVNGDTVKNYAITVRPQTSGPFPAPFTTPIFTGTNSDGFYMFELPDTSTPYMVRIEMVNCDNTIYSDSLVFLGQRTFNSDIRLCNIISPDTPRGYVYLEDPNSRPNKGDAIVYLIQKCTGTADTVSFIDSTATDTNGFYSFSYYPTLQSNCSLIMKARLRQPSQDYYKFLPAYHLSQNSYALRWHDAQTISRFTSSLGVNIMLPEAVNPFGGPAIISGTAVYKNTTTAIPGRLMFITDMHDVTVAYTYTDANGFFSFSNLQFGTYKVFGDAWDVANPAFTVTVDANSVHVTNILFTEDNIEYKGQFITTGIGDTDNKSLQINVYPNPVTDVLYVENASNVQALTACLQDVSGAVLWKGMVTDSGISTSALPKGVYILHVQGEEVTKTFRIVK